MSNMNVTGTAPEAAAVTEKELQFAKQQAELKSGEALLKGISREVMEQREKVRSSDKDEEQDHSKDTAEISETRSRFLSDGTISAKDILRWILEMEKKDWESLLEWQPDPSLALPTQLEQLSKLYLALLEAALKYAEGENLTEQLARLDALLAEKLNLLMDENLKQLVALLEESGQTSALDSIRSGLYRQTAGKSISPQAAHALFVSPAFSGKGVPFQPSLYTGPAGRHSPAGSGQNGMIYQSSGKQNIRFQQAYNTHANSWKEQIRQRKEIIGNARKGIPENTFKRSGSISFSGRELERANGFAAHITGRGNLFKNPGISARNDEVTGLLAAVMSIKGQVYAAQSRQDASITFPLQNAIEKIINQYISRKGASNVYYHTLTAYKQMQNPQKAIEDGQNYAYTEFRKKQRDPSYQKSPQYAKESGFFRAMSKNLSPEKEFALGINILKKDWETFLWAMGNRQNSSYLSRMDIRSPWGVLMDTGIHKTGRDSNIEKFLLGSALVIIIGVLAVICFRLI